MLNYVKKHPLLIPFIFVTALWVLRCILTWHIGYYGFITWNMMLAAIPLLLERPYMYVSRKLKGLAAYISKAFIAVLWMLFMPNAFYILTDFMHLNSTVLVNVRGDNQHYAVEYIRGDGIYIYDTMLFLFATLFGAYVGGLALIHGYSFLRRHLSRLQSRFIFAGVLLLSSIGVYIGRYGRWNSWEGVYRPWAIAVDLWQQLTNITTRGRFAAIILTMLIFQIVSVLVVVTYQRSLHIPKKQS